MSSHCKHSTIKTKLKMNSFKRFSITIVVVVCSVDFFTFVSVSSSATIRVVVVVVEKPVDTNRSGR